MLQLVKVTGACIFYLQGVTAHGNPQGLYRHEAAHVGSCPDICESPRDDYLVRNLDMLRYHNGSGQSSVDSGQSLQRDEERLSPGSVNVMS